jgi:hypothetical protein
VGLCTAAGQIWSSCYCTRVTSRSFGWGVLYESAADPDPIPTLFNEISLTRRRADCCNSGLDLFDQTSDESPVVFGSEMTPAEQGREEGLLGRGELPWLKEDPALAGAPLLRAVEPGALDGIAGEQGGGAVGARMRSGWHLDRRVPYPPPGSASAMLGQW